VLRCKQDFAICEFNFGGTMSVDKDNVIKIANLSKISFKDHEIEKILEDLNQIIDWVDQLTEVDTDKVSPTFSSFDNDKGMKKREDIINDGDYREDITMNAPNSEEGFFLVPKVID
jgi:aspartyl-tRNA(Asn)/glutamyl-tRNA(Gln) amidotransferase subunit C